MKKRVSLLLCAVLLLTAAVPLTVGATQADGFKAFVATDIHHSVVESVPVVNGKKSYFNSLGLTPTLAPVLLSEFLRQAAESDCDYVFLTGDLVNLPDVAQAQAMAEKLAAFEKESGKQVFVINGNHDTLRTVGAAAPEEVTVQKFKEIYASVGYDEALCVDENSCSYTADLKGGYRLIAIDPMDRPGNGSASITSALADWIKAQAAEARRDGKQLVAIMHYPLMNHFTLMSRLLPNYVVSNSKEACRFFAQCGIGYVFTGHFHQNDVAVYRGTRKVYDIETTALSGYPNAYRTASFRADGVALSTVAIEAIDTSSLPKGYNRKQRAKLAEDLPAYGYACLKKDSIARVHSYLYGEKIAGRLGVSDPKLVQALDTLLTALSEGLSLPLYGRTDSIESYAKHAGLVLPASGYKTMDDAVAAFIAAVFAGDEHFDTKSPLFRVLFTGVLSILHHQMAQSAGSLTVVKALRTLSDALGDAQTARLLDEMAARLQRSRFGGAVTDMVLCPLEPLLVGLTVDRAPKDNDVVLK